MIRSLVLVFLFSLSLAAFAQSKVTVLTEGADVTLNGLLVGKTVKINPTQAGGFIVAAKKDFVTHGERNETILDKGATTTIELVPIKKNSPEFKSKKIEFEKFITNSNEAYDLEYSIPMPKLMSEWGYSMIENNPLFKIRDDTPEFILSGKIMGFGKDNRGSGIQVSTIVNWTLLDVETNKKVFTGITGGFSDSKTGVGLREEHILALKDALVGLMNNSKFKEVTAKSDAGKEFVVTTLPLIPVAKYSSYSEVVKGMIGSVVTIKTDDGFGSGFIISKSGYLLTNNHVVKGADTVEVIFSNGISLEATLVNVDNNRDVALIKLEGGGGGFTPMALNPGIENLEIGSEVIAIGTAEDIKLNQTVTKGIVSGVREFEDEYRRKNTYIQSDVTLNMGNSGGPLINMKGEVVGIVVAKMNGKNIEGLGFAIPIGEEIEKLHIKFQ